MRVVITGGAGYIGSVLTAALLDRGDDVTVVDDLWFGGESLLSFLRFGQFRLLKRDICEDGALDDAFQEAEGVVHLAALVGFPACDRAGREQTWRVNVAGTNRVYAAAVQAGVRRLVFASSYSNYGRAEGDDMVTEESPLLPQSLYAESKIVAERFLLDQLQHAGPAVVCLRLATVFGLSPRTRFDLMVNQFVLDAFMTRHLILYQQDFKRSFVHVRDVAKTILCALDMPEEKVRGQVFNVGSEELNTTKSHLVELVRQRWPTIQIEQRDVNFCGDMRSLHVSFQKIRHTLGFEAQIDLAEGVDEICWALENGVIRDPLSERYRNHPPIVL